MQADEQLPCPHCQGAAPPTVTDCPACGLPVVRATCPGCFETRFLWSRACHRCGATAEAIEESLLRRPCPGCLGALARHRVGEVESWLCAGCEGRWLDRPWVDRLLADTHRQASLLWQGSAPPAVAEPPSPTRSCPSCKGELARLHFATGCEVLIDLCPPHGIWFDRDELARVASFIVDGRVDPRPPPTPPRGRPSPPTRRPPSRWLEPQSPPPGDDHDSGDAVVELIRFLVS